LGNASGSLCDIRYGSKRHYNIFYERTQSTGIKFQTRTVKMSGTKKGTCGKCPEVDMDEMVACDLCETWFHYDCVDVDASIADRSWKCGGCTTPPTATDALSSDKSTVTTEPLKEEFSTPPSHQPAFSAENNVLLTKLESSLALNIKLNKELAAWAERDKQRDLDFEALRRKLETFT
jgi:PHD-finger